MKRVINCCSQLLNLPMNSDNNPPARIYKFFSPTAQNLENLKNHGLYFSSPRTFNDPYDCSVTPTIQIPSDDEVELIRNQYLKDETIPERVRHQTRQKTTSQLREMFVRAAGATVDEKVKEFNEIRGVTCFSEARDDLLMWAHYGGSYQGFCLEFDTSHFRKLQKVKYLDTLPVFDPVPILRHEFEASDFMSIFSSKSPSWRYEKEWRAFHEKAGTLYNYPAQALTGVFFGPEISPAMFEIICLILQGQNENVLFWKGTRDKTQYKVNFEQVDYICHLQAVRDGLVHPS